MWQIKDRLRALSLITKLNNKVKFNELTSKEIIELYADFAWLDELKAKIEEGLRQQEQQRKTEEAMSAAAPIPETDDIQEEPSSEPKKSKKKTTRKKRK